MKRILTLGWVFTLTLGLLGCGGKGSSGNVPADPNAKPEDVSKPGVGGGGPVPQAPTPPPPPPPLNR